MQHTPLPLDTHKTTRALHRLSNSLPIFYLFDRRFLCPFCVNNLGNTLLTVLKSTYLSAPKVSFAIFLAVFFLKLGLASSTTLLCSSQPSLFDKISSGTYRGGYNGGVPSQPATNVGSDIVSSGDQIFLEAKKYRVDDPYASSSVNAHNTQGGTNPDMCPNAIMFFMKSLTMTIACQENSPGACIFHGDDRIGLFTVIDNESGPNVFRYLTFTHAKYNPSGGAFQVTNAQVQFEICSFTDNSCPCSSGSNNGGGAIYASVQSGFEPVFYVSYFSNNKQINSLEDGAGSRGTNHNKCPPGFSGEGTVVGSLRGLDGFSYTSENCVLCPDGAFNTGDSTDCEVCPAGKILFSTPTEPDYLVPQSRDSAGDCQDCPAGRYNENDGDFDVHDSESDCLPCPRNTHSENAGAALCVACPSSEYSDPGSTSCSECVQGQYPSVLAGGCAGCPTGRYNPDLGATSELDCLMCAPGKSSDEVGRSSTCDPCGEGKYQENAGALLCADCGEGKYLDFTGAVAETQCKVCPMGKYNDVPGLGTVCPDCQKGKYAPATGYTSCTNCIVGTYASDDGSTECTQCEEGKHSGVHGSETCDDCAAGTFTDYRGAVVCIFCSGGKYSSEGASVCLDCGQGTYSNPGSASCDTCEHTQGFVANGEGNIQCEYCGIGKYADTTTHECKSCMQGKYSVGGVNECLDCESGKFNLNDGASSCTTCEPGSVPNGATGCTQCIAGKYAAFGASSCSDCSGEGQFSSSAGAASCSTAAVGTKPNLSRNGIVPCELGSASPGAQDDCAPCDGNGQYADQTGLPFCKTAPAGTKPTSDRQGTEICSPGKYSIGGNDECSECGVGKTSDAGAIGCRTCATCGLGKYQIAECTANTETECGDCVAGKASMGGTVSECARCDGPGEYSEPKASVCKTAPAGYKPMVTGDDGLKTGIEMCLKNTFSIGATDECTNCAPGGHSNPGDSACDQCLTGKYYNEQTNDCTLCPKNTFSINGASDSNGCTPCASGEHSLEGSGYCQACPQYMEYDETTKKCVCLASFIRVGSDGDGNGGTCTCKPGETLMGTTCQPCEEAKWKAEEGVTSCNLCEDTLKGAITEFTGSQDITDCECPSRTFDNLKGTCVVIVDGVDAVNDGMTLTGLIIEPGFWRTGPRSVDVRECPVSDACIGGNETKAYCRDGHNGPYCNLCEDGYAKDPFLLCQSCDESGESVAITAAVLVAIALALAGATYLMKRGAKKEEERLSREGQARSGESTYKRARRRLKNGGKIIFSGAQISVSLPRVIPSFPMPENFKETLRTMRFFNLSVIEMFSMGCWTANFNVYYQVLVMTVPIIVICVLLLFMGLAIREHRQGLFTIAIAVTYLTLPTITTMIFSLFPCDDLDDGGRYLRSDYSIRCDGEERTGWVVFGLIMILVFPIGVTSAYWMLLWADRKKIQQPVEVREEDEELMTKAFLFEPYKPEYWYFEVVETARRLMMTGFLSTIEPGSFVQLSSGLLMSIGYVLYISNVHPYVEVRDNTIAVLTGCQLVLVFVTASFMKYQTKLEEGEAYEMQGLGVILILSYLVIFVLFLFWAWHQKDDTSRSSSTYATKTIKNLGKKVVSKHGLKSVVSIRGGRKNSASGGIELSERSLGGRVEEEERVFAYENPMTHQNFTTTIGGVSRGGEEEEEEDVKPPAIPMRVTSTGLLKLSKADKGGGGDEAGMTGITPPSSAPPPPPPRENEGEITVNGLKCGTKNTRLHGEWSQMWDEEHKAPYWMNKDGVTSTWDRPLGY